MATVLGLDSLEITILKMVMGSTGKQRYGDIGFLVSSMRKFSLPEQVYRPKFLRLCRLGLIDWMDSGEGFKHFKERIFRVTEKGNNLIRDFQIKYGGDYSFYKYFDPQGSNLNNYLGQKISLTNTQADVRRAKRMMGNRMQDEIAFQHELERQARKLRFFVTR